MPDAIVEKKSVPSEEESEEATEVVIDPDNQKITVDGSWGKFVFVIKSKTFWRWFIPITIVGAIALYLAHSGGLI